MIRRPPRSTHCISSAASDVYKRQVLNEYKNWIQMSDKMMIWNAESIKPHFDGKELAKMFEVSPGKIVKHLLDDQLSWQLVNPAKTKEDYAAYVEANKKVILSNIPSK
eukprot:TRINITY_DN4083_c0_g1_i8.p1 TRINITY_DN4083_c0_g1~~TRINITY_DN4083_c0_g1_i8.p1  ORF type:complete len:119 (+),score=47.71 TRINITY_DN4083_c0_g1_i8:34-357(+)